MNTFINVNIANREQRAFRNCCSNAVSSSHSRNLNIARRLDSLVRCQRNCAVVQSRGLTCRAYLKFGTSSSVLRSINSINASAGSCVDHNFVFKSAECYSCITVAKFNIFNVGRVVGIGYGNQSGARGYTRCLECIFGIKDISLFVYSAAGQIERIVFIENIDVAPVICVSREVVDVTVRAGIIKELLRTFRVGLYQTSCVVFVRIRINRKAFVRIDVGNLRNCAIGSNDTYCAFRYGNFRTASSDRNTAIVVTKFHCADLKIRCRIRGNNNLQTSLTRFISAGADSVNAGTGISDNRKRAGCESAERQFDTVSSELKDFYVRGLFCIITESNRAAGFFYSSNLCREVSTENGAFFWNINIRKIERDSVRFEADSICPCTAIKSPRVKPFRCFSFKSINEILIKRIGIISVDRK